MARLAHPFEAIAADVDESPETAETARTLAPRLANAKAAALEHLADAGCIVVGADQAASSASMPVIGKPGSVDANRQQLHALSGRTVTFYTAATVIGGARREPTTVVDQTVVRFRRLGAEEIDRYLMLEPSADCAGGCKVEGLGITLLDRVESHDPTALVGLPLIRLTHALRDHGLRLPAMSASNA